MARWNWIRMTRILPWLLFIFGIAALVISFIAYRSSGSHLNVTPDAEREIEKAKRR
jgi:beta-lactam-binding protein with PASTA domain